MSAGRDNNCKHYTESVKGCDLHVRCKYGDLVQVGLAKSVEECPDYAPRHAPVQVAPAPAKCAHLGADLGEVVVCPTCRGKVELKLFGCGRFGKCTTHKDAGGGMACCRGTRGEGGILEPCPGFEMVKSAAPEPVVVSGDPARDRSAVVPKKWSYGVTTVPSRRSTTLPRALASLAAAGFDRPRLFVDGADDGYVNYDVTYRNPRVGTYGNWVLSLWELYLRAPDAERYAIFQDDCVAVKNLRAYLDEQQYPERAYLNLYQYGDFNVKIAPPRMPVGRTGRLHGVWYEGCELPAGKGAVYHGRRQQRGLGAVGLVFDRDAVVALLQHPHMVVRPMDQGLDNVGRVKGQVKVDGAVVESMNQAGWREWVHEPSLLQHIGDRSSMGSSRHPSSPSFPGEDYDAMELVG